MKKGFTLIELLAVVMIIGILAAIAMPQYRLAIEKARVAEALVILKSIVDAQARYLQANPNEGGACHKTDIADVDLKGGSWSIGSGSSGCDQYQTQNFLYSLNPDGAVIAARMGGNFRYFIQYNQNGTRTCTPLDHAGNPSPNAIGQRVCSFINQM